MNASKEDEKLSTSVFKVRTDVSSEDVLVNASEILASASIMANEQAFGSTGSRRLQIFGLAQLIENAQLLVDDALDKLSPTAATH
ncbi:hypothetical protein AOA59_21005 [Pseudomonas sp. 2822-15]|uniref:DUF6124 family protein n=1 Tax=Pseudomonas sp. 2822-15 TaxID=1712677 RepID=UPI000C151604|nr:DUF3077 domain-containing protein [Pseudomonas sp. 2822-15]PIB42531.1 hypothetical protein AOA59_21005 [Pseudomonas sp. 2822-15]